MHELAIAESVVDAVGERVGGARVTRVLVEVGRLTCVEPDALRFCFEACARGTALEGAALEIVEVSARATCRTCGARDAEVDARVPLCACGSADLELVAGDRLLVQAVEVA
ncbi:hydrogenase maturation nickel metallochaperone HypA/HybF [Anaeromyxobacter oryzae]|uniref:Hydrogenase maturation factor HypA n=1 Tax=Anaeromyxobacter oryzae TaxID=2918170 RepID=A0ABM7WPJ7_9BACT|nr:hydrogenase maturation nickel metallochaperone HypA [Anaeromyxobacter oryzae]BDG01378.1 hydrogenase nickel incorporation protein HypA [Anaeromyxobacter oryzae]